MVDFPTLVSGKISSSQDTYISCLFDDDVDVEDLDEAALEVDAML